MELKRLKNLRDNIISLGENQTFYDKEMLIELDEVLLLQETEINRSYFKEVVFIKSKIVLKTLKKSIPLPKVNNYVYIDGNRYQVISNVFDFDLKCVKIYVR